MEQERDNFDIWEEVYYNKKLHYGSVDMNCTLYQLMPKKGNIVHIEKFKSAFIGTAYSYKIDCGECFNDTNIHTVFKTLDDYYAYIANEICRERDKSSFHKILDAVKYYFTR